MRVILRDHCPERLRRPYALTLHAWEPSCHIAGGEWRVSSFILSVILHAACVPVIIAAGAFFADAPKWKPPSIVRAVLIRPPNQLHIRRSKQQPEDGQVADDLVSGVGKFIARRSSKEAHLRLSFEWVDLAANRIPMPPRLPLIIGSPPPAPPAPSILVWTIAPPPTQRKLDLPSKPSPQPRNPQFVEPVDRTLLTSDSALASTEIPLGIHRAISLEHIARPSASAPAHSESTADTTAMLALSGEALQDAAIIAPSANVVSSLPRPSGLDGLGPEFGAGPKVNSIPAISDRSHRLLSTASHDQESKPIRNGSPTAEEGRQVTALQISPEQAGSEPSLQKIEHPSNGRFDVVVIQTSLADILPATAGLMRGRPVYSVYLAVGDSKEWILHYCAADAGVVQRGAIVQLPDPTAVTAPYPALTFRPAMAITGAGSHLLIHGSVDETGVFRNLKVIGHRQPEPPGLLSALARWRFRPALRKDTAVPVEIVLAIPVNNI